MANVPRLIPFVAEHLAWFVHRDSDYIESVQSALDKERRGPAFTAVLDERVVGCSGIMLAWPGLGVAWATFSNELLVKYPIWVTRVTRSVLHTTMRVWKLHRVELVVLAGNERNARWCETLGFVPEGGVARCYTTSKHDVVRYELVEKD